VGVPAAAAARVGAAHLRLGPVESVGFPRLGHTTRPSTLANCSASPSALIAALSGSLCMHAAVSGISGPVRLLNVPYNALPQFPQVREAAQPFIDWLEQDTESDSDEEDE